MVLTGRRAAGPMRRADHDPFLDWVASVVGSAGRTLTAGNVRMANASEGGGYAASPRP